jgi:hypothetical protein
LKAEARKPVATAKPPEVSAKPDPAPATAPLASKVSADTLPKSEMNLPEQLPEPISVLSGIPGADQQAQGLPTVIPGEDIWGSSLPGFERNLSSERLLQVLGRIVVTGRLSARGESAAFFIRPDFTWCLFPTVFEAVAKNENFKCRSDLKHKMLLILARAGTLIPFGPERYVAEVRTAPGAKRTRRVFRISTTALIDEPNRASLGNWPHEIEVVQPFETTPADGESAA